MLDVLKSASKIVFILMAASTVAAMFTDKISGEQFMNLALMAFAFYFSNKGETGTLYAGK